MSLPIRIEIPEGFLEEEVRCDYTVTSEMKKVWAVELDLLNEFQKLCKKYNIKYMASGGTMLGVVRHSGYIPWDDDIDLYISRDDYNLLERVANQDLDSKYFWQTEKNDIGSVRGHAQLRNSNTTGILYSELNKGLTFNQGVFIDIFPVDHIPDSQLKRKLFFLILKELKKSAYRYSSITVRKINSDKSTKSNLKRFFKTLLFPFLKITKSKNYFYNLFEKFASINNKTDTALIGEIVIEPGNSKTIFKSSTFDNLQYKSFEFMELPVPTSYDEFLTNQYGDWKIIKHSSTSHGDVFYNAESSYKNYI